MIDQFFDYRLGTLEYRSLRFETKILDVDNFQGNAVVNYTDSDTPYTRIIEHKHFEFGKGQPGKTVITHEYPAKWSKGDEPYYPVNNSENNQLFTRYRELATKKLRRFHLADDWACIAITIWIKSLRLQCSF